MRPTVQQRRSTIIPTGKWALWCYLRLESTTFTVITCVLTFWALYAEDLRVATMPQSADMAFGVITICVMVLFALELCVMFWVRQSYRWGFFMVLDAVAMVSMLLDIPWFVEAVGLNSGQQSFAEARAAKVARTGVRVGRIMRSARMIRMVRMVQTKLFKKWWEKREQRSQQQQNKQLTLSRNDKHVMTTPPTPGNADKYTLSIEDSEAGGNGLRSRSASMSHVPGVDTTSAAAIASARERKANDDIKARQQQEERLEPTKLGKELSTVITKKIILVILVMVLVTPFTISDDPFGNHSLAPFVNQLHVQNTTSTDTALWPAAIADFTAQYQSDVDEFQQLLHVEINGHVYFSEPDVRDDLRNSEIERIWAASSPNPQTTLVEFSHQSWVRLDAWLSIANTTFLVALLVITAISFSKDTNELVIAPIEQMVASVRRLQDDPFGARLDPSAGTHHKFEMGMLNDTLYKISRLLQLGFGTAGTNVIKNSLRGDELRVLAPGRKVVAVFGFCDIRNFTDVTECLQERVMFFVNQIATVVHGVSAALGASPNKNIGDAFLMVWSLPRTAQTFAHRRTNTARQTSKMREVQCIVEKALASFLKVIVEIDRDAEIALYSSHPVILKRLPDYRVQLGFGLHLGWAIEGAIGSEHKIDASYLSPNVNLSARLESATKLYGIPILMSGDFCDLLGAPVRAKCRHIDCVTVKGSDKPMNLYTFDLRLPKRDDQFRQHPFRAPTMDYSSQAVVHTNSSSTSFLHDVSIFDTDADLTVLQSHLADDFLDRWQCGIDAYISGRWLEARIAIEACMESLPGDGPSRVLLNFMGRTDFKPPADWRGFRRLTEK